MSVFENVRIETGRLLLRNFTHDDIEAFYELAQDPEIYRTLPEDHPYDRREVREIIRYFLDCYPSNARGNVPKFALAITIRESGQLIGDVGIGRFSRDSRRHEIFCFLGSQYWGEGYGSEAVGALLAYVREHRIVDTLVAAVVPTNVASARILQNIGFRPAEHSYEDDRDLYVLDLHTSSNADAEGG
jgi:ribosomal-protein-alanine N-acetyltransferase